MTRTGKRLSAARSAAKAIRPRPDPLSASDDDVAGSFAQEFASGKPTADWSTDDDGFYLAFYDRRIAAPSCWLSVLDGRHVLMAHNPEAIERADFLGITEPPEKVPAGWKKVAITPDQKVTGEDLLAQFARAIGAPVSTSKKRPKPDVPKRAPKKRSKPAAKKRNR